MGQSSTKKKKKKPVDSRTQNPIEPFFPLNVLEEPKVEQMMTEYLGKLSLKEKKYYVKNWLKCA